jgi:hypothetical protein
MSKILEPRFVCTSAALALWVTSVAYGATNGQPAAPPPAVAATRPVADDEVLARFKGGQITVADMQAAIANKDPATRHRLATADGRVAFLRELETYDLLALEAERRGYAKHPAVIDAARSAAIDAMLDTDLRVDPASIPKADVAREFATLRARKADLRLSPDVESTIRKQLAEQRFEQAQEELSKRLYEQSKPEIHAELVDTVTLEPAAALDQPQGFPPAPPDPRAPVQLVESDGI